MTFQNISIAIVATAMLAGGATAQTTKNDKNPKKPSNHSHSHKAGTGHGSMKPVTHPGPSGTVTHGSTGGSGTQGTTSHTGSRTTTRGSTSGTTRMGTGNNRQQTHGPGLIVPHGPAVHPTGPTLHRGVDAPAKTAFVNPSAPVTSNNYARPHYGNTYVTNNVTVINNNYHYDSAHYQPHVANFYGVSMGNSWGGTPWRYGVISRPGVTVSFGFGFYVYTPYYAACVASPWYYYPGVPAYLPQNRVFVYGSYGCDWNEGQLYDFQNGPDAALNQAIGNVAQIFSQGNVSAVDPLMGTPQIAIFAEGRYEYSLNPSDFRQMLADNISATQTDSFTITRAHRTPYGRAVIEATHVFENPTGNTETVYQLYRLQMVDGNYVITDFLTSHMPFRHPQGYI